MVQYIGVIFFVFCIVHYVYQAIILPSFRQSARDELFVLRDKLRAQLIDIQENADKKTIRAFKEVDIGINRSLNRLHILTFSNWLKVSLKFEEGSKLDDSLKKFHQVLEGAEDPTPVEIYKEVNKVLERVLVMNSLMFVIYLLPLVLVIKLVDSLYRRAKYATEFMLDVAVVSRTANAQSSNSCETLYV
ncbi:hypothetical protein VCSRO184_3473 [Vibrio cholerae]|nr:hypothetical protein [Vibrio cholerae]EGR0836100.1 hypothetical protein [Vibrio cholerae]EJL6487752.1 hypothetical protein [Vibrio cholerae]EKO4195213.1 hypothetical protein [Vibrio cholerae]GIB10358.1 hypothetical protein VCSRO184_3473 [Vibrio cholerae]